MAQITLYLFIAFRIISNSFSNVFQKNLTNLGINPLWVNFVTYFLLACFCLFLPEIKNFFLLSHSFILYSVIGGLLGALGNGFLVKAIQSGDLSVLGPINSYKSVVSLVFAIFLLHELPSLLGLVGICLIIAGSYFVICNEGEKFSFAVFNRSEIKYRFYALFFTALEAVFIKKIILLSSINIAFISWALFGGLFSFVILLLNRFDFKNALMNINQKSSLNYLYIALCAGVMQFTTNYVFKSMNVSYALALFQLSTLLSVFLGYKIFKEKNIVKKLIGSVIMIAGSVVIILYN